MGAFLNQALGVRHREDLDADPGIFVKTGRLSLARHCGSCTHRVMWPIYLINLDRATGRLADSQALLETAGLAFQRVAAIDGQHLDENARSGPRPFFAKQPTTAGEIACFLSHHKVWSLIAEGSDPAAIVLEDDFELTANAPRLLQRLPNLPCTWDMLKLYCCG